MEPLLPATKMTTAASGRPAAMIRRMRLSHHVERNRPDEESIGDEYQREPGWQSRCPHLVLQSLAACVVAVSTFAGCASVERDFGADVAFLRQHVDTLVLGADAAGPRVAVVPAYQGRVMTSTATGDRGTSYGWINYELIAAGDLGPHMNVFGGEDRFWLGPEGGQFAIFFGQGDEFTFENWQTPAVIDTEPYSLVGRGAEYARFRQDAELVNYSGTGFRIRIEREVRLLGASAARDHLDVDAGGARSVAYETRNVVFNRGEDWSKDTGLLSIWILGMFKPSPATTVVIPFRVGSALGPVVNDAYFGKVPEERLRVGDGVLFFAGDGRHRSKIGISPRRAKPVCGSWDATRGVLTIVQYNQPDRSVVDYVNSMWELQEEPYEGDVVNSYNDGSPAPGKPPLGPFYELETSSPALALRHEDRVEHIQRTFHFEGSTEDLDRIARRVLGVGLAEIEGALPRATR